MSWKRVDVQDGVAYKVQLCHAPSGKRTLRLVAEGAPEDVNRPADVVCSTRVVPHDLLRRRDILGIAETVVLESGEPFFMESNGIWLLGPEWKGLGEHRDHADVPWVTGTPPIFTPK